MRAVSFMNLSQGRGDTVGPSEAPRTVTDVCPSGVPALTTVLAGVAHCTLINVIRAVLPSVTGLTFTPVPPGVVLVLHTGASAAGVVPTLGLAPCLGVGGASTFGLGPPGTLLPGDVKPKDARARHGEAHPCGHTLDEHAAV